MVEREGVALGGIGKGSVRRGGAGDGEGRQEERVDASRIVWCKRHRLLHLLRLNIDLLRDGRAGVSSE